MEKNLNTVNYELNPHYYKSRNTLLLFSGLLFAWELIGVNFSEFDVSGMQITLDNSEALPFVLLVLIVYYMFRIIIEWINSDYTATENIRNRLDHWVTLFIPFIAMATYSIQKWLDISIFQNLDSLHFGWYIPIAIAIGIVLFLIDYQYTALKRKYFKK